MSADTTQENLPQDQTDQKSTGNDASAELASVKAQLAELIESQKATMQAIASQRQQQVVEEPEDDNIYDPQTLLRKAERVMDQKFQQEQAKAAKIAELSRDYPEINSDTKLMNDIVAAQRELPESIRNSPVGYETAILKAVTKAGLVPKSRRQAVEEDVSMGNRGSGGEGGTASRRGKAKVTENMLRLAALMGRDVDNPEYIKRLEAAANRSDWKRYK